ncbi:MAG TPA: hypothetical protein VH165_02650 [Kofleriaceae bacterium]|jgi:hypothetical protein|nr:hypothetical protein [Kofleriaceae bacterium]
MSNLQQIELRHRPDGWRDVVFVVGAVLLTSLSLGSVTSKAVGPAHERQWTLTVLEGALEVGQSEAPRPR